MLRSMSVVDVGRKGNVSHTYTSQTLIYITSTII